MSEATQNGIPKYILDRNDGLPESKEAAPKKEIRNDHAVEVYKAETVTLQRHPFEEVDTEQLLNFFFANRADFARVFLKERGFPATGTKDDLKERLRNAITSRQIAPMDVLEALNQIEGWGKQHGYLLRCPEVLLRLWRNEARVKRLLQKAGALSVFNSVRPLWLPLRPTLSGIEWNSSRVRMTLIAKRVWNERVTDRDRDEGEFFTQAYRRRVARSISWIEIDLRSGTAIMMLQQLPRGSNYGKLRREIEKNLRSIIDLTLFEPISVSQSIEPLSKSGEVTNRQVTYKTVDQVKLNFTSASRHQDAFSSPYARAARDQLGVTAQRLGNFYTIPNETQPKSIHFKIYAEDQRLGIFGQRTEEEVRHVLERIRHYCA